MYAFYGTSYSFMALCTVELVYNNIGLLDTSLTVLDIMWQLIRRY